MEAVRLCLHDLGVVVQPLLPPGDRPHLSLSLSERADRLTDRQTDRHTPSTGGLSLTNLDALTSPLLPRPVLCSACRDCSLILVVLQYSEAARSEAGRPGVLTVIAILDTGTC